MSCHSNTNLSVTQPDLLRTIETYPLALLHHCKSSEKDKLKPNRPLVFPSTFNWTDLHCKEEIIQERHEDNDQTDSLFLPINDAMRNRKTENLPDSVREYAITWIKTQIRPKEFSSLEEHIYPEDHPSQGSICSPYGHV